MLHWHFYFGETKGGNHKGCPLEFSPFCNPLSLTPVAIQALMTKIWYFQELYKRSFLMHTVNRMIEKIKSRINSQYRSSARWTESRYSIKPTHVERTRGEIRKRDFKRGDRRAAGVTLVLTYVVEMLNIPNQLSII